LNLQIINPLYYPGWDELLLSKKKYSFFHSSHWARVLSESYNYTPLYFVTIRDNNLSVAIPFMEVKSVFMGKRGVSLPFSDYCVPIISEDVDCQDVLNQIIEYGEQSNWKYIELRGEKELFKDLPCASHYYTHTLDLSKGSEQLFSNLRSSTKRNIKKAVKKGVKSRISYSPESLEEFYRLNCLTRKNHGLPPQPYYFFERVYDCIIKEKLGFFVLASYKEKIVAGAMFCHFGDKALYKYGASDKRYLYLRPNNLVMWEAIKWYSMNGFKCFSFGRTEPDADGQRQFKTGFGTNEATIRYYTYDLRKGDFISKKPPVSGLHNKVFRAMPISFLKIVGTLLYKHMG